MKFAFRSTDINEIKQTLEFFGIDKDDENNQKRLRDLENGQCLFFGVLISADSDDENSNFSSGITGMNLSAEVLKHQPMVEKYARENGISEYVNVLLAIIQVESGGTAEDVMQSSESLGLPPNSLDTESSIKQGCKRCV